MIVNNNSNIITPWPDTFYNASLLTNGNFTIADSPLSSDFYRMGGPGNFNGFTPTDTLVYIYSGLTEYTAADVARNRRIEAGNMYLNLDYDDLRSHVYFGKASDVIIQEMNKILKNWPASLYIDNLDDLQNITVKGVYYDPFTDTTTFKIPVSQLSLTTKIVGNELKKCFNNPYNLVYSQDLIAATDFANIITSYSAYTITTISGNTLSEEYPIIYFTGTTDVTGFVLTGTTNISDIHIVCHGNPFMVSTTLVGIGTPINQLSCKYHIKPAQMYVDKFFASLSELQNQILNRYSLPKYEFNVKYLMDDGDVNTSYVQKLYWPTSDYYNLDINTKNFNTYLSQLRDVLEMYDDVQTNILQRRLTEDALIEYDITENEKITKYLRAWGWSYDKNKRYIDGISFVNNVSYDKKRNVPDDLILDHAKKLGWDLYSPFRDMPENVLYERDVLDLMYPGWSTNYNLLEIETELWRRLAINSIYFFKSKGTRKSVENILSLLGIPDNMLVLNEYIYTTNPINYNETFYYLTLLNGMTYSASTTGGTYVFELTTSGTAENITYNQIQNNLIPLLDNPVIAGVLGTGNLTGFPLPPVSTDSMYFHNQGGWLESDPNFLSPDVYDYGKKWLDNYRYLGNTYSDGLMVYYTYSGTPTGYVESIPKNIGFTLNKTVDNIKSWPEDIQITGNTGILGVYHRYSDIPGRETDYSGYTNLVLNTKEVDMFLDFSKIVTSASCVTTAGQTVVPTTPSGYIEGPTYSHLINYVDKLDKFWIDILKQMVPATTIFRIGVVYSNCQTGADEYYLYNYPSTQDSLHFITPYFALSGDQFTVITGYTFSFSGYNWTETSWLQYQSQINPGLDIYNPFNLQAVYGITGPPNNYPGLIFFPPEIWGDPNYDPGAF